MICKDMGHAWGFAGIVRISANTSMNMLGSFREYMAARLAYAVEKYSFPSNTVSQEQKERIVTCLQHWCRLCHRK
jgi:hypothetical protein